MNVYELISSMFNGFITIFTAMIWPISIIIVVVMLKKPITNLIQDIATIKYGGFELNFIRNKLEEMEGEIEEELKSENDPKLETDENKNVNKSKVKLPVKQMSKSNSLDYRLAQIDEVLRKLYLASNQDEEDQKINIEQMELSFIMAILQQRTIINRRMAKLINDSINLSNHYSKQMPKDIESRFADNLQHIEAYLNNRLNYILSESS
ncbi:hypothetical protein [Bacillus altitudinis]|uniref:hypothetical protein n=1 Tax=Bacillus altitudinis TaxID=293387 RepID=UPI0022800770|nr:hypothetical protein [Bacillus altitudinis]MCY7498234.1 hypothetical protein [Bacillus altitudinis]MCY7535451.1 hypothetical protein [Bacillus altitudinis]MCY7545468.1 hypothetical protein [Bacillus altitudinis]MCY7553568.1 hypothetical protein [Bacillus altitudinis]MCY7592196.1 hypothetical protein [Bacillus altitudinis]